MSKHSVPQFSAVSAVMLLISKEDTKQGKNNKTPVMPQAKKQIKKRVSLQNYNDSVS